MSVAQAGRADAGDADHRELEIDVAIEPALDREWGQDQHQGRNQAEGRRTLSWHSLAVDGLALCSEPAAGTPCSRCARGSAFFGAPCHVLRLSDVPPPPWRRGGADLRAHAEVLHLSPPP